MRDWTDDEPGLQRLRRELSRLKRRAIARPFRTLGLALAMAGAVVYLQARKPPLYTARLVLSVTEGDLAEETTPAPKRQLRSYIADVSFNKQNLRGIIEQYDLYSGLYDIDPQLAVETMWDDLDVEVYQNYFLEGAYDQRGSARIAITYRAGDPELALSVVRDLGEMMVEFEAEKRREVAASAAAGLTSAQEAAESRLDDVARRLAEAELELDQAEEEKRGPIKVRVARLRQELEDGQARLEQLERARAQLDLARAAEAQSRGLIFRVVDEKRPERRERSPLLLVALGAAVFLLALPLSVVAVGAFDARIYDGGDIARLGMPVVGHVPDFEGAGSGALKDRRRADHR